MKTGWGGQGRCQVAPDGVTPEPITRQPDPAADHRQHRKHDERYGHHGGHLVQMRPLLRIDAALAGEGDEIGPEDVERGAAGRGQTEQPDERVAARVRGLEHHVLREEAGEARHARDGERSDQEGASGDRHLLLQTTHVTDAQLPVQAVHDGPRTEEQQGLEEGVGHEVEDSRRKGADADADDHVADLGDRRVREDLLEVLLDERDRRGEQTGHAADQRNHVQCGGSDDVEGRQSSDHVHAGGDHRGGVDEGRNRRRTGHGVRQPDVERDLRRLAGRTDQQQQAHGGRDPRHRGGESARLTVHLVQVQGRLPARREAPEEQEHADQERRIADPVGQHRLLAGIGVRHLAVPEADQQVRAEPDALPADEHHRQRVGQHQDQHRAGEEVQVGEISRQVGVVLHVSDRIEMDEEPDPGDDEDHHGTEGVDAKRQVDRKRPHRDPRIGAIVERAPRRETPEAADRRRRNREGEQHHQRIHDAGDARPIRPGGGDSRDRADQGQQRDPTEQGRFLDGHGRAFSRSAEAGLTNATGRSRRRSPFCAARSSPG